MQSVEGDAGSEKQQGPKYGPDPVGEHPLVYGRQFFAVSLQSSVAGQGKTV